MCLAACSNLFAQDGLEIEFVSQQTIESAEPFDKQFYQTKLRERHTEFDAYILTAKKDRALQIVLTDSQQEQVLRKPVPSEWIEIARDAERIALIDKPMNPGFGTSDGRTEYRGILVWDFSGELKYQLPEATFVAMSPSADLLVKREEALSLYGLDGELNWKLEFSFQSASFVGNGQFVQFLSWDKSVDKFVIRLVDTKTGELCKTWTYVNGQEKRILHVDSESQSLLMAEFDLNRKSPCDLIVYHLDDWEIKGALLGSGVAPFSVTWNPHQNLYCLLSSEREGVSISCWDPDHEELAKKDLGSLNADLSEDWIEYDLGEEVYTLRIGREVIQYRHAK